MIKTIGIIGAGQMGNGIAHVSAQSGLDVLLLDISEDTLKAAIGNIDRNMDRQVNRSILSEQDRATAMGRIRTSTDYSAFKNCDIVIEAATEDELVKVKVLETLVPHLRDVAMIATNTSSISVTRLAASTDRPEKFIGMHFMNPVPVLTGDWDAFYEPGACYEACGGQGEGWGGRWGRIGWGGHPLCFGSNVSNWLGPPC